MTEKQQHNIIKYNPAVEVQWGKVTPISQKDPYKELSQFCSEIRENYGGYQLLAQHKNAARFYRTVFMGLSFLFAFLMLFILYHHINLFFVHGILAKAVLSSFCALLSIVSFCVGFRIRAEKEAVHHLFRKSRRQIKRFYGRKKAGLGWQRFLVYLDLHQPTTLVMQSYHEAIEKMHEAREHTLLVLDHVVKSRQLNPMERDSICHQAILKLRDQMNAIVLSFNG